MNAPFAPVRAPRRAVRGVRGVAMLFGLVLALVLLALGALAFSVAERQLNGNVDISLEKEQQRLLEPLPGGEAPDLARIAARIHARIDGRTITNIGHRLLDRDGRVIVGSVRLLQGSGPVPGPVRFQEAWGKVRAGRAVSAFLPGGGRLDVVAESELLEDMGRVLWPMSGVMLGVASIGGIAMSIALSQVIAGRLNATRQTADAIVAGDLTRRVPVSGLDGMFADQARTFNRMLDRIEQLMTSMRQMSADVAHDLRTPITRLQANLEAGARDGCSPAERETPMRQALDECTNILTLFGSILRLSEIETGRQRAGFAALDVTDLLEEVAESMEPLLEDAGLTMARGDAHRATAYADRDLLNQLLVNLVENSVRHAGPGAKVTLAVTALATGQVRLRVADSGPGIAAKDRERAVRRFVRLDRSRSTPGHGLGLALADAIARLHGGRIELGDNRPGLIVDVLLPTIPLSHVPARLNAARSGAATA